MGRSYTSERRFGPRWLLSTRALLSVVVAWPVLSLLVLLIHVAGSPDPRFGAILFFLLGIMLMFVVPIVWWLWRPTFSWRRASREGWRLQQRLDEQARIERRRQAAIAESAATAEGGEAEPAAATAGGVPHGPAEVGDTDGVPAGHRDPAGRPGRHRAAASTGEAGDGSGTAPPAAGPPRLAVRGTEGQVVTVLVEGTGARRKEADEPAVRRSTPAGPPVWPGHETPGPGG
jgi:hypothetical protein